MLGSVVTLPHVVAIIGQEATAFALFHTMGARVSVGGPGKDREMHGQTGIRSEFRVGEMDRSKL